MKKNLTRLFYYSFAFIWAFVTLYPLFIALISSVKENGEIYGSMFRLPQIWHFDYYSRAIAGANMLNCIKNSLIITTGTTLILLVLSSMASFVLVQGAKFKISNIIYLLFITGIMIPVHSTLIPLARIMGALNGNNNYLIIMLVYTAFQLPMSIFLITGYMKLIPKELTEAAIIDGCSMKGLLFRIFMPISAPGIATSGIIAFLFIYNELIFSVMFITERAKFTISLGMLYFVGDRNTEMGPIFASIILAVVPMVIIYLLFQEKVQRGMIAGSVKG
ncbi:carbohydrate ABC transporter permease [Treponema sp.]